MNTSEKIHDLSGRLSMMILDSTLAKNETGDMATILWLDKTVAKLEDAMRTLHNAQVAAEKSEGFQ